MAGRENCVGEDDIRALWFNASENESHTSVSEGRKILISLGEPRFIAKMPTRFEIDVRCTKPFYRLSRDFRYQAPPLFSRALKRSG